MLEETHCTKHKKFQSTKEGEFKLKNVKEHLNLTLT